MIQKRIIAEFIEWEKYLLNTTSLSIKNLFFNDGIFI